MEHYNFSATLSGQQHWYNYYERAPESRLNRDTSKTREGRITLHGWQEYSRDVYCAIWIKSLKDNQHERFACTPNLLIKFSIGGGNEIPHFCVTMDFKDPTSQKHLFQSKAIWTAWGDRGFDTARPPAPREIPTESEAQLFTFSSRLQDVKLSKLKLTGHFPSLCMGKPGNDGLKVSWAHLDPPYMYGVDVPDSVYNQLAPDQKRAFDRFRRAEMETQFIVVTRAYGTTWDNWRLMASMPVPTYPPYPLYDCQYTFDRGSMRGTFKRVFDLPGITASQAITQFAKRKPAWMNMNAQHSYVDPVQILSMGSNAPLEFINERQYEVIKAGGLLREADLWMRSYNATFNGEYEFSIYPVDTVHGVASATPSQYFYGVLKPRNIQGFDNRIDMGQDLPELGTPVRIVEYKRQHERDSLVHRGSTQYGDSITWFGVVIAVTETMVPGIQTQNQDICVRLKRPSSLQIGTVLKLNGRATFGQENAIFRENLTAVRSVMYGNQGRGVPFDNKLKTLILAHENRFLSHFRHSGILNPQAQYFLSSFQLNSEQSRAVASALDSSTSYKDFLSLVTGPPGTGKTTVAVAIALCYLAQNKKVLIVTASNRALDVIRVRLVRGMRQKNVSHHTLYRLETEYMETSEQQQAPSVPSSLDETNEEFQANLRHLRNAGMETSEFELLRSGIMNRLGQENEWSLGRHILGRLEELHRLKSGFPSQTARGREELELLLTYMTYRHLLVRAHQYFADNVELPESMEVTLDPAYSSSAQLSDHRKLVRDCNRAWVELQVFYLREAGVVMCTASTAGRPGLRRFRPDILIIDEASQISEATCLNPMIRFYSSLKKIVLCGDTAQLPPTVTGLARNEFLESEKLSLFERLIKTGVPDTMLKTQYRMHPGISAFVNTEFYNGQLLNGPGTARQRADLFARIMSEQYKCSKGASYFFSVRNSSCWTRKGGTSLFNPEYVVSTSNIVENLISQGILESEILVLTYYNEELKLLKMSIHGHFGRRGVQVSSVDLSQGDERDVVIISTTRLGGNSGLGFLTDRHRLCVGLSCPKNGRIIVGDAGMDGGKSSQGFRMWKRLVQHHRESGLLVVQDGTCAPLKSLFNVPNDEDYVCHGTA